MRNLVVVLIFAVLAFGGQKPESLKLGLIPYLSADVLLEKYAPLADYLQQTLGRKVEIVISSDHNTHIEAVGADAYCIAFMGGNPYVRAVARYGPRPLLARYEFNGEPFFRSAIIVAENSPLRSIEELKGKRFAFGSPDSTLSAQMPLYTLNQAGITLRDLDKYVYLKNHENVVYGVLYGDFDAGAVAEEVYQEWRKEGIRALTYSDALSTHLFIARSDMDETLAAQIREALFALNRTSGGRRILEGISPTLTGFVPVQDSDYDKHRAVLEVLHPPRTAP